MSILLPAGKVSKLFGLDGGVLVNLYDSFHGDVNREEPLFVKVDGLAVPLFVEHFERRGRNGALVRFADIDTTARAEELLGAEMFTAPPAAKRGGKWFGRVVDDEMENDDEIFFDDLVGYKATVVEDGGATITGAITAFIDSELNPLLQLETGGSELFIPAADEFIDEIDTAAREVIFTVPSGLLELYL